MKVSYNVLNTFFDGKLPSPSAVGEALTFHAWEIEEIVPKEGDTLIDIKVLPDKSAWALSHRGIAKDLSVVLNLPLSVDPLAAIPDLSPTLESLAIHIETPTCTRYTAALITGVKIGPSPEWLVSALATLGQRSINNVVDITNYVMFSIGQPLHAFDAGKLEGTAVGVRNAKGGETITTLTGETYMLTSDDAIIVDGATDAPIGIAGIKGGKHAEVDTDTVDILLESANFGARAVRKTSQRLKLRTDASTRYENGIVPEMAGYGLRDAVTLMASVCGGEFAGYADTGIPSRTISPVSVTISKINSVLGLTLTSDEVESILKRFGYPYMVTDGTVTVTPPFERTDLSIPEDLIEEIGRIHGYKDIPSVTPEPLPVASLNKRFYYGEAIRDALTELGFSEVYTSSFRNKDEVKLQNAFASDKGYLRSSLRENLKEALGRNVPHKDLLGIPYVGIFEIGTVFKMDKEYLHVALGVRQGSEYKEKTDLPILDAALKSLRTTLGAFEAKTSDGVAEFDLGTMLENLPTPSSYAPFEKTMDVTYVPFSQYPAMSRDIAFWVGGDADRGEIEEMLKDTAGPLCARIALFDEFNKDGRTSYAFRFVFQSHEKTLTDSEVNPIMDRVYHAVSERGWETR